MLEKLQNKKAEGYIDVAVAVLVIVFLLVFSVGIFSKIAVKQDLSHMCSELVEVATTSGRIGPEVQARYEQLCKEAGIRPTISRLRCRLLHFLQISLFMAMIVI